MSSSHRASLIKHNALLTNNVDPVNIMLVFTTVPPQLVFGRLPALTRSLPVELIKDPVDLPNAVIFHCVLKRVINDLNH